MREDWKKRAVSWLGKNSTAQQIWAISYLGEKGWFFRGRRSDESNYDYLVTHIREAPEVLKSEDDLRKMKRAWSQKKKRDEKTGPRKPYSFTMNKSVGPKLRYLVRKRGEPAYQILETIISEYQGEVKSGAWLDMSRKQLEKRMKEVEQQLKGSESKRKELDLREAEIQRQLVGLEDRAKNLGLLEDDALEYAEALDNKRDLISQLFANYTDVVHAHIFNKWVIGQKASLPPVPLNYQGRSKFFHLLEPYQDLLASLKR